MAVIEQEKITKYCKRQIAINKAKDRQEILHKEIYDQLLQGYELPTTGPSEIVLSPNGGKALSWKEAYEDLLTRAKMKRYGVSEKVGRALAQKQMEEMYENAPAKPEVTLGGKPYVGGAKFLVRVNDQYRVVPKPEDAAA